MKLRPFDPGQVRLGAGPLQTKRDANRRYLLSLDSDLLLLPYRWEAGLWTDPSLRPDLHGGWEAPTSQLRGHFLGHWLSAAAARAASGDKELRAKAEALIDGLAVCQTENGGEWAGSIPEKYLEWTARNKAVWAPHYTVHKTFQGLVDFHKATGYAPALEVAVRWSRWFHRWTSTFSREKMDDILDYETGGLLEIWADLLELTGEALFRDLLERYTRSRLFDPLLEGTDVVTNRHANTTIPEVLGAARAYEVTGEARWLRIVEGYWDQTVTRRGRFATGGQTCGEIWTPPGLLSARLGDKNQEHCTVFNMMRLAEFLLRWTGRAEYADYWEENLLNGVMAQGHWEGVPSHGQTTADPTRGLITYFLPLRPGAKKGWASEKNDFFCCHGSLVQANATHTGGAWYQMDRGVAVAQYLPSEARWVQDGVTVTAALTCDSQSGDTQAARPVSGLPEGAPDRLVYDLRLNCGQPITFVLNFRLPAWLAAPAVLTIDGVPTSWDGVADGWGQVSRLWSDQHVRIELPKALTAVSLPGDPELWAFRDGPVVLAGLCDGERALRLDPTQPEKTIVPDNEREWRRWTGTWQVRGQGTGLRLVPLHDVGYERYTVYFRVSEP